MKPFNPALLPHLRPARTALAWVVAAGLGVGLLTVGQAFALGVTVVRVVGDPAGEAWHAPAAWLALATGLRVVCGYVVDVASARAAGQVAVELRHRLLDSTTRLDRATWSRRRTGEITALATRGIAATEPYLTRYLPALLLAGVLPIATVAAITWLDWLSGLIVVLTIPLIPVFAVLIGLVTRDRADAQWRELGALAGHFLDVVRGLPTLVVHRRATPQADRIRAITERYRQATIATLKVAFLSSAVLELIATISVALVAVNVGLRLAHGGIEFETAMVVLLLAPEAYWPLRRVGAEFHSAAEGTAAFEQVSALLNDDDRAQARLDVRGLPLRLDDLTLAYPDREQPAVAALSASIRPRGLTAISGPSGCGKSTLLAGILGELAPTTGAVRLGEQTLSSDTVAAWREQVAWAPQRPWLVGDSVAVNLRIGRPSAGDDELWSALRRVGLDEAVAALPLGLDTELGEDGAGLSAGQRARLALARIIVADRPWVLLDEPTAHLDSATESVLLDTMRWLAERSAVVVVAHREAVIDAADDVIRLPAPPVSHADHPAAAQVAAPPVADATPPPAGNSRWARRTGILLGAGSVAFGVALTATAAWLITRASEQPPVLYLLVAIVGVRLFGLGRPILRYAERMVSHDAALRLLAQRRAQVYTDLVPLVPGALGRRRGDVLASVVDDVDAVVDRELRVRQPVWAAAVVAAAAAGFAGWLAPLAGLVMTGVAVVGAAAFFVGRTGAARAEADFVTARAQTSERAADFLGSVRHRVMWQDTDRALGSLDEASQRLAEAGRRTARAGAVARALPLTAGTVGLLVLAAVADRAADVPPAQLALLLMLPIALVDVFVPVADAGVLSVRTSAAQRRLAGLAGAEPLVTDPVTALDAPTGVPHLETRDVDLGWGATPAVRGLSMRIPPGARVGVVGPSGSGKSTVAASLVRFLDPSAGSVRLGTPGVALPSLRLDDVRRLVTLVDEDPHVFSSTVAENIRLARPEASDEDVLEALGAARLGDWISTLPDGLHTFVGEGHAEVSGGERARLALARAHLADPPLWVLDEPTAHLDTATARAVADEILTADSGRSLVWITHTAVGLDHVDEVVDLGALHRGDADRRRETIRSRPDDAAGFVAPALHMM